jgi:putative membrane protein
MIDRYRDHAANERTYLAWVRTGITVMVLGFIVEKFELFLASLQGLLADNAHVVTPDKGPEQVSIALVSFGVLMSMAGAVRFFRVKSRLDSVRDMTYQGVVPTLGITLVLLAFGIYLLLYLARIL